METPEQLSDRQVPLRGATRKSQQRLVWRLRVVQPGPGIRPVTWLVALLVLQSCAPSAEPPAGETLQLPRPDLTTMEVAARSQIEEQEAIVTKLLAADEAAPAGLAKAVGDLGRLYHAYGLDDSATVCYQEAERLDPTDVSWPYYLGFLHQIGGELDTAADSFERALRLSPDDPATLVRLARVRLDLGETEAAEALFRRSLEGHPSTAAAAHAGLARIAGARGRHAEAAEHYEAALALQPQATRLHYPLALAYRELGETSRFEEHLGLRGEAPVVFPDPLAMALDSEAAGSALHISRAGVALAEGRSEVAVAEYRLALAADPTNATARYELGMLLAAGGDLAGARIELEEALRLHPENSTRLEGLARVLAAGGSEDEALPLLRRAVELDPARAAGHLQLAAALARSGSYESARRSFDRALGIDPALPGARLGRAEVLLELGLESAAAQDLETVLRGEPDNARASLRLGEARQRLGEAEAALASFEAALGGRLQPTERAAALLGAANLQAGAGDLASAIGRYR
jgi:tetratricopeptide (TPR) repeat protein